MLKAMHLAPWFRPRERFTMDWLDSIPLARAVSLYMSKTTTNKAEFRLLAAGTIVKPYAVNTRDWHLDS
jgi:hypothetical protein